MRRLPKLWLTSQRQDLVFGVHDGRVSRNGSPQYVVGIGEVDDDNLILLADFLAHTDEVVTLKR